MPDINLLDETFDQNQSIHYHLSIQVDNHGITFCVLDTVRNKYTGLKHFNLPEGKSWQDTAALKEILLSEDALKFKYKSICCMIVEGKNTLVPLELFDPANQIELLKFNHRINPTDEVMHNTMLHAVSTNIFAIPTYIHQLFLDLFPGITIYHRVTPFIENLIYESGRNGRRRCFVSIHEKTIDIGIAHLKNLEFFNTFEYKDKADITYYLLAIMQKFDLPVMTTEVHFSADMENHDEIFDFLNRFLNHVRFIRPVNYISFSYTFDEVYLTRFANLFNLALCVL